MDFRLITSFINDVEKETDKKIKTLIMDGNQIQTIVFEESKRKEKF